MSLSSTVADELDRLRAMSMADIRSLPKQSHKQIESSWRRRRSVSVYAEPVDSGAIRVIVKAFESQFPHVSTRALAMGFRVANDGQLGELIDADKATLY